MYDDACEISYLLKADRMFVSIFCAMKIRHMRQLFCFEDKKFEILN
jgi:hypothetical protein